MKLYHFNPHDYGDEAFVMAESKEKACEYLRNSDKFEQGDYYESRTVEMMIAEDCKYVIEEYSVGEVVRSEIC